MVHRPVRRREAAARRQRGGRRNARYRFGGIGEPEEGEAVAVADVEEEMLAAPAGKVDRLGERHAELVAVEFDRSRHILAHEREVIDPAEFELAIRCSHHPSPYAFAVTLGRLFIRSYQPRIFVLAGAIGWPTD